MAGGVGSRFWPYSRNKKPKQFLDILNTGQSLLQMTADRYKNICPRENIYIVTNEIYGELVQEQLPDFDKNQILLETERRNTAPCIAYAAFKIKQQNENANMVIAPSDHIIFKEREFEEVILKGLEETASKDILLTIGIKPNRPETGYGYIHFKEEDSFIKKVKTFTEKPELELATKFVESGEYVWNAGIFIWSLSSIINAFNKYMPDLSEMFDEGSNSYYTEAEAAFIQKVYAQCKSISIDYAVMEKANNVYVALADFGWSDLGSWNSLHEISEKNGEQNVIDGNALLYDTHSCYIKGEKDRLIVVQGLENYLIADCDNVLVICPKDAEKKFREFVKDTREKMGNDYL